MIYRHLPSNSFSYTACTVNVVSFLSLRVCSGFYLLSLIRPFVLFYSTSSCSVQNFFHNQSYKLLWHELPMNPTSCLKHFKESAVIHWCSRQWRKRIEAWSNTTVFHQGHYLLYGVCHKCVGPWFFMIISWNTRTVPYDVSAWMSGNTILLWRWLSSGTGFPERR